MAHEADAASLNQLSATALARMIAKGEATSEQVVRACLDRIASREPQVRAWAALDADLAIAQARICDNQPSGGPLHGVPFAVKDVIDTADLPTQMGSRFYAGYRPKADAACVARLRAAGAIVLGKTTTAEFAGSAPTLTHNPHNLDHTPGGSSSGSAAAVADSMVPVALGTQTGGSVLRPSSFCGLIGFKPTFGTFNPVGVKPAAESFDTVGLIARSLDDIELVTAVLANGEIPARLEIAVPRIGVCRTHLWDTAQAETREALDIAARHALRAGAHIEEIAWPETFANLSSARATINAYERAHSLAFEWQVARGLMEPQTSKVCEEGLRITWSEYTRAQRFVRHARQAVTGLFDSVDVLLTPCVPGEAPIGLAYAGDPRFQEIWTMLHVPTITLPAHRGPNNLPVGIQLVAPMSEERRLLDVSRWLQAAMA